MCCIDVMSFDVTKYTEIIQRLVGWTLEALSVDAAKEVPSPVSVVLPLTTYYYMYYGVTDERQTAKGWTEVGEQSQSVGT